MEQQIFEKIRQLNADIKKISYEDRHFNLDWLVSEILNHVLELKRISQNAEDKQQFELIWKALDHTSEKEVKFARLAFEKSRKKNAPFIREKEYRLSLIGAIEQVESELTHFRL